MPSRKRNLTAKDTDTPKDTVPESIPRIVTEVLLTQENKNDCPMSLASYAISVHLATLNIQFEKLLTFNELVSLLNITKVDTQEHKEQIKASLKILLRSDPNLSLSCVLSCLD